MRDYIATITLPFTVEGDLEASATEITKMLGYGLCDVYDGRQSFAVETLLDGFRRSLKTVVRCVVEAIEIRKHPNEIVSHYNSKGEVNGNSAKWYLTARERMRDTHVHLAGSPVCEVTDDPSN